MKTFKLFAFAAALIAALPVLGLAQSATQSTTLTTAAPGLVATSPQAIYNTLYVASTTGMSNPLVSGSPGSAQTFLYIDREAMPVMNVVNSTTVQVLRGDPSGGNMGTGNGPHVVNSVVWFGPYNNFVSSDPSGSCTAANYQYLPLISTSTGHLINCDAISSTSSVFARTGNWYFVNPAGCGSLATTTTTTDNGMVSAATGNVVHQFTTSATGGTTELTCPINPPDELLSSAKGIVVTSASLLYGVQTTAISSIATATVKSVTYPASTAAGVAAAGTVAAAGGTITATPSTLQKATTTTGLCYNEQLTFGTPFYANTNNVSLAIDQVFTNSAAATQYQVCGLEVYYDLPL